MGRRLLWVWGVAFAVIAACGSEREGFDENAGKPADPSGGTSGNPGFGNGGKEADVASLAVDPPSATLLVEDGKPATQPFKVIATFVDGKKGEVAGTWTASNFPVGTIAGNGVYTANGQLGGHVKVTASYKGKTADGDLTVKLHVLENPNNLPPATIAALKAATNKDASIQWAYPYDGTVFPRGLAGPKLMWNGGAAGDAYYVHVTSATIDVESFATVAPPARFDFVPATWTKLVDSTSGAAELKVARFSGGAATVAVTHKWTISPASMRGTIYYWANNVGRVMRIKPGATAPDDFSAGTFGALPASTCTMTCHTVSADGSTLVSGGDTLGGSYDLLTNKPIFDTGGAPGSAQKRLWSNPALSPNGKWLVQNGTTSVPGPPGAQPGLFNTADGTKVANSGLDGISLGMPGFSPDGSKIAYVIPNGVGQGALASIAFDMNTAKAGASTTLVLQGSGQPIAWPSVTPDGKWVVYHRGPIDTRFGAADLFLASAVTPNQEVRLAKLDGDGYPFAAGARDLSWNYEPTFAPVPSGGYFWVVFTSRRTYGNLLTGDKDSVKQLWVAAIDLSPQPGVDPSHPPFLLPGQALDSVNMRGFWALDPCKGDGQGCASGTECCGGFCDGSGPSGAKVCKSAAACSQDGDKCNQTSDCCNAASGTQCIAGVCSEPGPK